MIIASILFHPHLKAFRCDGCGGIRFFPEDAARYDAEAFKKAV